MQDPAISCSLQIALAPQGDGWQGVGLSGTTSCCTEQLEKGSPMKPISQKHDGE